MDDFQCFDVGSRLGGLVRVWHDERLMTNAW
jgi:hypothetical protein